MARYKRAHICASLPRILDLSSKLPSTFFSRATGFLASSLKTWWHDKKKDFLKRLSNGQKVKKKNCKRGWETTRHFASEVFVSAIRGGKTQLKSIDLLSRRCNLPELFSFMCLFKQDRWKSYLELFGDKVPIVLIRWIGMKNFIFISLKNMREATFNKILQTK